MGRAMEARCRRTALLFTGLSLAAAGWAQVAETWPTFCLAVVVAVMSAVAAAVSLHISLLRPAESHSIRSLLLQYLVYSVLSANGARLHRGFVRRATNTRATQTSLLMTLLNNNKHTDYGLAHGFESVRSREEFREFHPLTTYADYQRYIRDVRRGKTNVLTRDPVVFLSLSSGTTSGAAKVIPVTDHMTGHTKLYVGSLMCHIVSRKMSALLLQRVFALSYKSPVVTERLCYLDKGPISSHMSRYVPFVVSPEDVFQIANEQSAFYVHALFALQELEVGSMEALMSTLVYSFWRYLEGNWPSICDDIERGTIPDSLDADRDIVITLRQTLRPNPARAADLRAEFARGFRCIAHRVWPHLTHVRMLTTGGFANHARILRENYMVNVAQISLAHVASEGFLGFNMADDPDDFTYTAMIEYSYLEFIPLAEIDIDRPSTVFAEQVEVGGLYEMVTTTPMGLYRYRTGDVIEVVDFCGQCPVYEFRYRTGQVLNVCWERTPESVLYEVVTGVTGRLDHLTLVDYTATEDIHLHGLIDDNNTIHSSLKHYVLFVELEAKHGSEITPVLYESTKEQFDQTLRETSELYNRLRTTGSIGELQVYQVRQRSFEELKRTIIEETQNQQYKVPRVLRQRSRLQFLLSRVLTDLDS